MYILSFIFYFVFNVILCFIFCMLWAWMKWYNNNLSLKHKLVLPLVTCTINAMCFWRSLLKHFPISNTNYYKLSVCLIYKCVLWDFSKQYVKRFIQLLNAACFPVWWWQFAQRSVNISLKVTCLEIYIITLPHVDVFHHVIEDLQWEGKKLYWGRWWLPWTSQ